MKQVKNDIGTVPSLPTLWTYEFLKGCYFWDSSKFFIQHCFICRPSDFTVSEDAGIEPRTVATLAIAIQIFSKFHPEMNFWQGNIFPSWNPVLKFYLILIFYFNLERDSWIVWWASYTPVPRSLHRYPCTIPLPKR
jgi:hypothetical protein